MTVSPLELAQWRIAKPLEQLHVTKPDKRTLCGIQVTETDMLGAAGGAIAWEWWPAQRCRHCEARIGGRRE